ncbi:hypothetical protein FRC01_011406 [Tulasnella sp. 417]|nr:hypothetical protein FRC01_011406 [Tulasnella sp. 417]
MQHAIAFAENIKSFGLSGVAWLWGEEMKPIQDMISKMKLTNLRIYEWWPTSPLLQIENKQQAFANLRKVLRDQPLLRDLRLEYFVLRRDAKYAGSAPIGIASSDIPILQTIRADAATVAAILPVVATDQLELLEIDCWKNSNHKLLVSSFSGMEEARQRVQKLQLSIDWIGFGDWDFDFGQILELFPNVDSLKILGLSTLSLSGQPTLLNAFFEKVASQITQSPNITVLEMSLIFESNPGKTHRDDVQEELESEMALVSVSEEELILGLKTACPQLKTFIDPAKGEWEFLPCDEGRKGAFRPVQIGRLYSSYPDVGVYDLNLCALEWDL